VQVSNVLVVRFAKDGGEYNSDVLQFKEHL